MISGQSSTQHTDERLAIFVRRPPDGAAEKVAKVLGAEPVMAQQCTLSKPCTPFARVSLASHEPPREVQNLNWAMESKVIVASLLRYLVRTRTIPHRRPP
jgi:hypothetical protein